MIKTLPGSRYYHPRFSPVQCHRTVLYSVPASRVEILAKSNKLETAQNTILLEFFERRQHLLCVVNEYGGMTGVISLEDVIEEIVGQEIVEETDPSKSMREIARDKGKTFLSAGRRQPNE